MAARTANALLDRPRASKRDLAYSEGRAVGRLDLDRIAAQGRQPHAPTHGRAELPARLVGRESHVPRQEPRGVGTEAFERVCVVRRTRIATETWKDRHHPRRRQLDRIAQPAMVIGTTGA
jgi:hypothetical protein